LTRDSSTATWSCRILSCSARSTPTGTTTRLAAEALAQADPGWLADLITRQVPLGQWADAYTRRPDDIKTILSFADESP
jgi:hypothetical protein